MRPPDDVSEYMQPTRNSRRRHFPFNVIREQPWPLRWVQPALFKQSFHRPPVQSTLMLNTVRDCCDVLLRRDDNFWAMAALTGCSFETNGPDFSRVVRSFASFGLPAALGSQLLKGVNGNLAALVNDRYPHLQPFSPNKRWRGIRPDMHFGPPDTTDEVVAEVKGLHDLTTRRFYGGRGHSHSVANDRQKLLKIRASGFNGHLFQIVFFLQLPAFERPTGIWKRTLKRSEAWRNYRAITGVESQYSYLRGFLVDEPVHGPVIHPLTELAADTLNCMSRRYSEGYTPDDMSWSFSPARHLAKAAVGCAIWQY
jgi:hypothetical protein